MRQAAALSVGPAGGVPESQTALVVLTTVLLSTEASGGVLGVRLAARLPLGISIAGVQRRAKKERAVGPGAAGPLLPEENDEGRLSRRVSAASPAPCVSMCTSEAGVTVPAPSATLCLSSTVDPEPALPAAVLPAVVLPTVVLPAAILLAAVLPDAVPPDPVLPAAVLLAAVLL